MKFTLKSYNDLGRCSMGTLLDEFDTEKYTIRDNGKVVKIKSVEDLFPYLWQSAGISGHCDGKHFAEFFGKGTHWHWDFDRRIVEYEKEIKRLEKKVYNESSPSKKEKYQKELDWTVEHLGSLKNMIARLDADMEEQKQKLIEENR